MLIRLPGRVDARKRALDWLVAHRISHLVLFQEVKVHDLREGERFKAWLSQHTGGRSQNGTAANP